mmetsp:Transcript_69971/g.197464  ORF Transcript_69971/g.197464 Transcript_69971/m.197464 type:complete len:213 (+) Transcript_69971:153-791(+)
MVPAADPARHCGCHCTTKRHPSHTREHLEPLAKRSPRSCRPAQQPARRTPAIAPRPRRRWRRGVSRRCSGWAPRAPHTFSRASQAWGCLPHPAAPRPDLPPAGAASVRRPVGAPPPSQPTTPSSSPLAPQVSSRSPLPVACPPPRSTPRVGVPCRPGTPHRRRRCRRRRPAARPALQRASPSPTRSHRACHGTRVHATLPLHLKRYPRIGPD